MRWYLSVWSDEESDERKLVNPDARTFYSDCFKANTSIASEKSDGSCIFPQKQT